MKLRKIEAGRYDSEDGRFEFVKTHEGSIHSNEVAWYVRDTKLERQSTLLNTLRDARLWVEDQIVRREA